MADADRHHSWKSFLKFDSSSRRKTAPQTITKNTLRHANRFIAARLEHLAGVKRHVLAWVIAVVLLIGVSTAQWLQVHQLYTVQVSAAGGTYSEGVLGPLETLNPIFAHTNAEKSAARLMFASLYQYDATGRLRGDLAESVSVNDTETEYIVKLRSNLKWSDGAPLNAKDVVFTANLLKNPRTQAEISGWQSIATTQVDDRTVKFSLPSAYAPFVHALTFPVLPEHTLSTIDPAQLRENTYSSSPVTSGPFVLRILQNATSDGSKKIVNLKANPYYHRGQPKLERFQLYVYQSKDDIAKGLRTSEIMATPELTMQGQTDQLRHRYHAHSYRIQNGIYALFNTQSDILGSKAVRQALVQSIDTRELRQKFQLSNQPLNGPLLHNQVNGGLADRAAYNIDNAKMLLDSDGWKVVDNQRQKDGRPLQLSLVALKNSDFGNIVEELARSWRERLQMAVDVRIVDASDAVQDVLQTVLRPRAFDILVYELAIGADPDTFAYWHSSQANQSGLNFSNYNNTVVDDALTAGRSRRNPVQRLAKYQAFVKHWQADAPALALYQPQLDYIQLASVSTLGLQDKLISPTDRFANVIYWSINHISVYKTP